LGKRTERRSYYRINDTIGLAYSIIDHKERESPESSGDQSLSITRQLSDIDRELNQAINTIWHENTVVSHALGLLNRKLSLIASDSIPEESKNTECYEDLVVSISGYGMAFSCIEQLSTGDRLRLSIKLKPSNVLLQLGGKVVVCEDSPENLEKPFLVRVILDAENQSSQELLIQHIVQKQCSDLGKKD